MYQAISKYFSKISQTKHSDKYNLYIFLTAPSVLILNTPVLLLKYPLTFFFMHEMEHHHTVKVQTSKEKS